MLAVLASSGQRGWSARLGATLKTFFSPEQSCCKKWGPEAIIAIYPCNLRGCCSTRRLDDNAGAGRTFWRQFRVLSSFTPRPEVAKCGLNACGRCRCCLVSAKLRKCALRRGESAVLPRSRSAMLNLPHTLQQFRRSRRQENPAASGRIKSESYVYAVI